MALLSQLFPGDAKLDAASFSDPAHITPRRQGAARRQDPGSAQSPGRRPDRVDSQYGPKTAAAVVAFKTKRNILNTAGKIDNIVGIKTMAALDTQLLKGTGGGA